MTSGLEAVGDAATGAIVAGAVEPAHGGVAQAGEAGHGACLNCGAALTGPFCQNCGQNSHLHRTIAGFMHDLLHGVFHFDGKIWRTLPLLLFRPGELTRRYIAGERAKFVSPLAMFLFCVFLMFAIVGSLAGEMHGIHVNTPDSARSAAELDKELASARQKIAALSGKIEAEARQGHDTAGLIEQRDDLQKEVGGIELVRGVLPSGSVRSAPKAPSGGRLFNGVNTGWAMLDRGIEAANENPSLFLYRLQSSAYKYSWLLIPISTPLVWLLFFWKRQYKVYDHLVFVTLSLTFMLLLVTTLTIAGALGVGAVWITLAAVFIPPLHSYKQLRGAYASGRIGALLRTVILMIFGIFALSLYMIILLLLGVTH